MTHKNMLLFSATLFLTCGCLCAQDASTLEETILPIEVSDNQLLPLENIDEQNQEPEDKNKPLIRHLSRDYRNVPLEEISKLNEDKEEEQKEELEEQDEQLVRKSLTKKGRQDYQVFPAYVYGGIYHNWVSCAADWSIFEIEDGSQWMIAFEDRPRIVDWHSSHPLVFRRNNYSNSNAAYNYQLYNTVLNESIQVFNIQGPWYGGFYTREVVYVDSFFGDVGLTDYSKWVVAGTDQHKLSYWYSHQAVMVGIDNEWRLSDMFNSYPIEYVLINIELNNSVRAGWVN